VPPLGIAQIVGVVGLIEWRTGKGIEGARIPGDIGFDPLGLSEEGISEKYALAELKNGRLAMIAVRARSAMRPNAAPPPARAISSHHVHPPRPFRRPLVPAPRSPSA
jgi:hypothetical protein